MIIPLVNIYTSIDQWWHNNDIYAPLVEQINTEYVFFSS